MAKKQVTFDDIVTYIKDLPYNKFKEVVALYASNNGSSMDDEMSSIISQDFQKRLENLGVNSTCPKCGSPYVKKNGMRKHIQVYKCNQCNTKFTRFTDTILEKTQWHWDIWIKVLEMTLNRYSLHDMKNVLEKDYGCVGINIKTIWAWRMKLIHALADMPMPKLSGVVYVDETFIREAQKGSRHLVSHLGKKDIREPRYGRRPSKLGVMGPEFATVTTAIDKQGYSVAKVTSLGKLTIETFVDLFDDHFDQLSYLCSDGNDVYEKYCELRNIPHYMKPSNQDEILKRLGYINTYGMGEEMKAKTYTKNRVIMEKAYNNLEIERITNRGVKDYNTFLELKHDNGLSLSRVNELHSDIKDYINGMTNVSTQYLQDYIGFFTYIRNWKVSHGHYPTSRQDAEQLMVEILTRKVKYTIKEIQEKELELPKPSSKYTTLLKEYTMLAREATDNKYFKFNEEDGVKTFNMREYLLDQPKSKLYAIAKECKLTKYRQLANWSLVSLLLKQENIHQYVYRLIQEDRNYLIEDEDIQAILEHRTWH